MTGLGYEGHHLWDHELYAGQLLTALEPAASRAGIEFRIATLDAARARARDLGLGGAQYPWRTIDGAEASPFFPAGAAQHHLNADLAWALDHYLDVTGDDGLLADGGLAMLVETARTWMSIGRFDDEGRFRIEGVTGPDEYTALVDNNLFTNVMAARHLISAADRLDTLASDDAVAFDRLAAELGLVDDERAGWRRAAAAVVVAYDDDLGVHGQDDGFLQRARWPPELLSAGGSALQDRHPLLVLYRHQVLKQADVVHAGVLVPERFDAAQRRRDLDYYEPLTSHDSSLSAPIHAIAHADVGCLDAAWSHCRDAATVDLDDHAGTLADGLHLASAAGSWLAVARGFGGFVVRGGLPTFRPRRPSGIARMRFAVRFRGRLIEVIDEPSGTTYTLHGGEPVDVVHHGEQLSLSSATPSVIGASRSPDDAERRAVP